MQTCLNIEVKLEGSGFLLPVLQEATHKGHFFPVCFVLFVESPKGFLPSLWKNKINFGQNQSLL